MIDWKHLQRAHTGYFKHLAYASYYNLLALGVLITGIIHSIIPWLFPFTPYNLAKKIVDGTERNFKQRHNTKNERNNWNTNQTFPEPRQTKSRQSSRYKRTRAYR